MAKDYYLSYNDAERAQWLTNFTLALEKVAGTVGVRPEELAGVQADQRAFVWTLQQLNAVRTHAQAWTAYKKALSSEQGPVSAFPVYVPAQNPPPAVPPGIFKRLTRLVNRIKSSRGYDDGVGRALGIIGPERVVDLVTVQPVLKVRLIDGGQPEIGWKKQRFTGLRIEVDRGAGWVFLAVDTIPAFLDKFPLPKTPAVWKYRAMYLKGDTLVGQWSTTASVTVVAEVSPPTLKAG